MSPEETGDHLRVSWNNKIHIGTKLARWKSSISGRLVSWPQIKKVSVFKCCLLLFYATMNHFLIELWHAMESKFNMMTGDNQLSGWTKKKLQSTSQSQAYTKKSHGHCLVVCCLSDPLAFWIPAVKPLHLRSILSESMKCTKNCNACSQHNSTERSQFFSMTTLDCTSILQKLSKLGYEVLPYPPYSPDLSPTNYHFFKHPVNFFCRENASTTSRR